MYPTGSLQIVTLLSDVVWEKDYVRRFKEISSATKLRNRNGVNLGILGLFLTTQIPP